MSDREGSRSPTPENGSNSPGAKSLTPKSRSYSRSRSPSVKRSRSRSYKRSYSRSRSRSPGRKRRRSRSRSRSPYRGRKDRGSRGDGRRGYHRSHSRSPMSRRRRHVGNRDNPETSNCLGVFGLSLYTQDRDIREVFGRYGPLDDCNIVYDHHSGRSRGFGFVYFKDQEDAAEAKEKCAGMEIDGRRIRVDFSVTKRAHTPTPGIYLGKPTTSGYRERERDRPNRRSPSPYHSKRSRYSRSRSRSYTPPRRY